MTTNTEAPAIAEALEKRLNCSSLVLTADVERAAAELRRLSAVEAERDDLKLAFAHTVRLVQDWKQSAYAMEAERDALRAALADAAQSLETISNNAGKRLDSEGQENMLAHHDQVRSYANSRAGAARAAMKGTQ